jgi:hypothetical protein
MARIFSFHHNFELWLEKNGYDVKIVKSMTMEQVDEIVKNLHIIKQHQMMWIG